MYNETEHQDRYTTVHFCFQKCWEWNSREFYRTAASFFHWNKLKKYKFLFPKKQN
jgi:hypothetical protein